MDLLEYQGKAFLGEFGIFVPQGIRCDSVADVEAAGEALGFPLVLKAQVPVGGRGKAGGVRLAAGAAQARSEAEAMLGMNIKGHRVASLWLEPASAVRAEWYASFTLDRSTRSYLGMLSTRGGMDIEEVAASDPGAIARLHVDPLEGLSLAEAARWVSDAGLRTSDGEPVGEAIEAQVADLARRLFHAFVEGDAELVEVNPLALDALGNVVALDAKVSLDSNASFRHPEWAALAEVANAGADPREALARSKGLQYVGLGGSVGIIANGAGLAMSSLDVVADCGGEAANFLDIGGGASAAVMAAALEVILSDPKVASIFVNIFGGITRCDEVATGILEALERGDLSTPIVLRLDGTNAQEGREILASRPHPLVYSEPTMLGAAARAVELAAVAERTK